MGNVEHDQRFPHGGTADAQFLCQLGHTHAQLAGLQHIRVDELVDGALVAGVHAAPVSYTHLLLNEKMPFFMVRTPDN